MLKGYTNKHILSRLLIIIGISGLIVWNILVYKNILLGLVLLISLGFLIHNLLLFINKVFGKVEHFIKALENKDTGLVYQEKDKTSPFNQLYKSLDQINEGIRQTKEENKKQESLMHSLLENINAGIILIDESGAIPICSQPANRLLQHDALSHISQIQKHHKALYKAFHNLHHKNRRLISIQDGKKKQQLLLQASSFCTQEHNYTLIAIHDIDKELNKKEAESWEKLIRVLTHEIMNSISPILSLSDTLYNYYNQGFNKNKAVLENTQKGLKVIKEQTHNLISFVDSYRKLSRIPDIKPEIFSIKACFEHLETLLVNEKDFDKIRFTTQIQNDDFEIEADRSLLIQVLINLIINAIQASPKKSSSYIKLEAQICKNKECQISVTDNGGGIPEEVLEEIFIPFFTTKETGNGIGLSLSQQIMRAHGGYISVQTHDKISCFVLSGLEVI